MVLKGEKVEAQTKQGRGWLAKSAEVSPNKFIFSEVCDYLNYATFLLRSE